MNKTVMQHEAVKISDRPIKGNKAQLKKPLKIGQEQFDSSSMTFQSVKDKSGTLKLKERNIQPAVWRKSKNVKQYFSLGSDRNLSNEDTVDQESNVKP